MTDDTSTAERWAYFRHAVIGTLLIAPPEPGQLRAALRELSRKSFAHPVTGEPTYVGFSTLEKWFYAARSGDDPCAQLRRKVRKDAGKQRSMNDLLVVAMQAQYAAHPTWSYALHYKNLDALVEADPRLGPLPSYPTVRRAFKSRGFSRRRRSTDHKAEHGPREVRSFEMPHAHALWHLDFHHGKRNVMRPDGTLVVPKLLAVIDDHSRVCCHAQWYIEEGAEQLVHALVQAILKRGLPRALMMDNGSAMVAAETQAGLQRLGIRPAPTETESPYQNGKQETFFAPVEGQLIAMLEGVEVLDLDLLNRATLAWIEGDYHRSIHREIGMSPLQRLRQAKSVGRPAPSVEALRDAFRLQQRRKQRRGDGTCSIEGVRFEIPTHYRHIETIYVRYARFDLSRVSMVDARSGVELCRLRPLDKEHNAQRRRAQLQPVTDEPAKASGIAPHLARLMADYERPARPPAYLPDTRFPLSPEDHEDA
ncbi:MAG TPA: DDE-type integrase/transposase/recombinase [Polyangiales bacterium]|nr:DDE-type integrase/transposase/recombinase [Polyangiales bacterium]